MVRYAYNQQVVPPAPFVHVTVRSPQEGADGIVVPAQIDTAADLTVIPGQFVEILRLAPLGSVSAVGLVGHSMTLPTLLSRAPGQGSWSGHGQGHRQRRRTLRPARKGRAQSVHDHAGRAKSHCCGALNAGREGVPCTLTPSPRNPGRRVGFRRPFATLSFFRLARIRRSG